MAPLLFCNIAWMNEYQGHQKLDGDVDEPVNGGSENGDHECCNFLSDEDGNVYGHVETWKGYIDEDHRGKDTKIQINNLGAKGKEYVDGVDVIWSATPSEHNKRVIGWYLNATVYRERQFHKNDKFPTSQHKKDGIDSYRIVAKQENVHLIPVNERTENLIIDPHKRRIGFPGMNSAFYPINHRDNEELVNFIERLYGQINRPVL